DRVIARLQQPFPLEYIPVEAEYQSAASDYGTLHLPFLISIGLITFKNHLLYGGTRFQKGENQEGEDETDIDVDDTNGRRLSWHSDMDNGLLINDLKITQDFHPFSLESDLVGYSMVTTLNAVQAI
ncbi:augmin subunit 2-like protein, partial [Tanacetum coccineum]